jgi:hypothetical protein
LIDVYQQRSKTMSDQEQNNPVPSEEPAEEDQGHGEPGYIPPESERKEDEPSESEGGDDA